MIHRLPLTVSTYILYSQITDIYSVNERVGVFVVSAHRLIWPWRFLKLNTRKKKHEIWSIGFGPIKLYSKFDANSPKAPFGDSDSMCTAFHWRQIELRSAHGICRHIWISATIEYDIQSVSTSFYYLTIEQQAEYSHLVYFFFPLASSSFKIHFYIYVCCAFRGFVCVQRALQMRRVECEWTNLLHCVVHNLPSIFGRRVDGAASTHNSLIK